MLCRNLVSVASGVVDEDGSDMLSCSFTHEAELDFANDDDIRGTVRRLEAKKAALDNSDFELWQQAVGFRYEPHGLLMDNTLDGVLSPTSVYCHDWMHAMMVQGVLNTVLYLVLESNIKRGFKDIWARLEQYLALWTWPVRLHATKLPELFSESAKKSSRKAGVFKATASEPFP